MNLKINNNLIFICFVFLVFLFCSTFLLVFGGRTVVRPYFFTPPPLIAPLRFALLGKDKSSFVASNAYPASPP